MLIVGFGSLAASTPYLGIILLGVIVAWLKAVQARFSSRIRNICVFDYALLLCSVSLPRAADLCATVIVTSAEPGVEQPLSNCLLGACGRSC